MAKFIAGVMELGTILGIMVGLMILNGFTLCIMWSWFIAQTFKVAELTIPQAMGLSLIISYLSNSSAKLDDHSLNDLMGSAIGKSAGFLLIGWCIHTYMVGW